MIVEILGLNMALINQLLWWTLVSVKVTASLADAGPDDRLGDEKVTDITWVIIVLWLASMVLSQVWRTPEGRGGLLAFASVLGFVLALANVLVLILDIVLGLGILRS